MRITGLILFMFFLTTVIIAQDITVRAEAPSVVSVGEQFRVTWTVNSRGGEFIPPEFIDFYKLMGPQTSYSQSTQIINGKRTSSVENSFTYYLQATREGKYEIGPAKYKEKKNKYLSESLNIEVIESGSRGEAQPDGQEADVKQSEESTANSSDLYIRLLVNRKKVFLGEHIVATLKIYSRVNLSGIQEVRFPDFNSFLKEDLETPQLRTLERENVGGQIYNTGVLQRFLVYPQKTGLLEIDPATLTVLIQQRVKSNDPFFGDFFSSVSSVPKIITTSPVEIEVKPLPAGKPESFNGTVGNISVISKIDKDTIDVNDALTYKITINGEGNLKLALAPALFLSPDIEVYDPKIISNLTTSASGTTGSRLFEYLLIPRHHGLYTIPSFEYSFFDPDLGKYITRKIPGHKFYVRKSENESQKSQVYGGVTRGDVTYLGKDIRYINKGKRTLGKSREMLISKSSFFIFYLSSFLIFILIVVWRREHVKRNSDLIRVRNRKAGKIAAKRLKQASVYLKKQLKEEFHSELIKALWGYLSDKLGIPLSDLTRESVLKELSRLKVSDTTQKQFSDIIDMCESSRYSPEEGDSSLTNTYKLAEKVIKEIENQI